MLRELITQDFYLGFLIICLFVVVATRQLFSVRFSDFIAVIWNDRYLKLYSRERKKIDLFNILLFINFIIACGVFIFIAVPKLDITILNKWYVLFLIFGFLSVISGLKIAVDRFIAITFNVLEFGKIYQFQKTTYTNISGLIFLPSIILLLFSNLDSRIIIFSTLAVVFLINFIGFIRFLKVYQKALIFNLFYFLLYLCALEIGPYIIFYKVIKVYFV